VKDSKILAVGELPEDLYHGAVVAFGFVYEYIFDKGVDVTKEVIIKGYKKCHVTYLIGNLLQYE
jgi:hypothetical protein